MFPTASSVGDSDKGSLCVSRDVSTLRLCLVGLSKFALREQGCFPVAIILPSFETVRSA